MRHQPATIIERGTENEEVVLGRGRDDVKHGGSQQSEGRQDRGRNGRHRAFITYGENVEEVDVTSTYSRFCPRRLMVERQRVAAYALGPCCRQTLAGLPSYRQSLLRRRGGTEGDDDLWATSASVNAPPTSPPPLQTGLAHAHTHVLAAVPDHVTDLLHFLFGPCSLAGCASAPAWSTFTRLGDMAYPQSWTNDHDRFLAETEWQQVADEWDVGVLNQLVWDTTPHAHDNSFDGYSSPHDPQQTRAWFTESTRAAPAPNQHPPPTPPSIHPTIGSGDRAPITPPRASRVGRGLGWPDDLGSTAAPNHFGYYPSNLWNDSTLATTSPAQQDSPASQEEEDNSMVPIPRQESQEARPGVVDLTEEASSPLTGSSQKRKRPEQSFAGDEDRAVKRGKTSLADAETNIEEIDLSNDHVVASAEETLLRSQQQAAIQSQQNESAGPQRIGKHTCIICMEPFTNLTTTVCGHPFCHECLTQALMAGEKNSDSRVGSCPSALRRSGRLAWLTHCTSLDGSCHGSLDATPLTLYRPTPGRCRALQSATMSLFGEDPPAARVKSSLFDDDAAPQSKAPSSSMFGDDGPGADNDSPWGFTPKKSTQRGNLVRSLLADTDVPDVYIDTFDELQSGGRVRGPECQQLLRDSGIGASAGERIWDLVSNRGESSALGLAEFKVLVALVGLAQEGEELSLDAVDERRRRLPLPTSLPAKRQQAQVAQPPATPPAQSQAGSQAIQSTPRNNNMAPTAAYGGSLGDGDPWASPDMHRGHGHSNGVKNGAPQRTTSTFTTSATEQSEISTGGSFGAGQTSSTTEGGSWGTGGFAPSGGEPYGGAGPAGEGFGDGSGNGPAAPRRINVPRIVTSKGAEEVITVNLLEEKEGMFMFQHRNYEVASIRRNSKVIRRYSDFIWLLDCLHKRYPFRQLPLLPPKRVAINGNHIAADATFLEKRRRGLVRFSNALVRHPVLREEQLVELAVWRKQATISVQEEFIGKALPPSLEDSLPQDLQDTFDTVRSGVRRSAELYITLCNLVERLCKRKEAIASEYGRFSLNLTSLAETSSETYAIDANEVPLLNEGINSTAKHLSTSQSLLEDEARAWDEGLLEDLKTIRDSLVSMRDMFDRRDRYARDNIPQLERKIMQNESKLQGIKAKGEAAKPGEAEKVEKAIVNVSRVPPCRSHTVCADDMFKGQAIDCRSTCPRCLHQGVRARRTGLLAVDARPHFSSTPGLGSRTGQVCRIASGQLSQYGGCRGWDAVGRLEAPRRKPREDVFISILLLPGHHDFLPAGSCSHEMAKRKADTPAEVIPSVNETTSPAKRTKTAYTSQQKTAINELVAITQADKSGAAKVLKQHAWNVQAAINSYFSNPSNNANSATRTNLTKTFDKYRDDPKNEPDEINAEGAQALLGELEIGLDDVGSLIFSEIVSSPTLGKFTREGFVDGWSELNIDTLPKMRNCVLQRRAQLGTDRDIFKSVYNHTFQLALAPGAKTLPLEMATEFWRMLFSEPSFEWHTQHTPWLDWWLEFQDAKQTKAVNRDLWKQTLSFARQTVADDSLAFWNEESSWPSVIDEFVEWVKTEKRPGAGAEAMEVE
nr:sorting nexin mvp1 [Quercus suber]